MVPRERHVHEASLMGSTAGPTIAQFFELWALFRDPTLAGTIAGALLGWLGVYVVLRRMVFFSAALSQAASLGVAGAYLLEAKLVAGSVLASIVSPSSGAFVLATGSALLLSRGSSDDAHRDGRLGLVYLVGAAGTLALATRIMQDLHDIETLLFGSGVAVLPEQFKAIVVMSVAFGALHIWWMRGFVSASFDTDGARVRGVPTRVIDVVLLTSIAAVISVATRVLGALPVFAFSVLPAMAAVRVAPNVPVALWVAAAFGAAAGFAGYLAAFLWSLPVGAAQTLCAAAIVIAAELGATALRRR
jgi:zinc transport system permease protein